MWIQELDIQNFGKFQNSRIILKPGINLIYGENESGKSTIHAFIRGCFYGVKKQRGRVSKSDVYSRYQPWEHSAYYAGQIRFVCGGKQFRLSRDFTKGIQSGELVCETDGELLSLEQGDLEILLGNVGEMAFDNTVSIGQLRSETDEGLAIELKNHMANYEGAGNSAIKIDKAVAILKDKKRQLQKEAAEEKRLEEEKRKKILAHLSFLNEEKEKDERELERTRYRYESIRGEADSQMTYLPQKGLFSRLIDAVKHFFVNLFKRKSHNDEQDRGESYGQKQKLEGKIEQLEYQIQEKGILIENGMADLQLQETLLENKKIKILTKEIEGCDLAMKRVQEVVSRMQMDVGLFLKKRTSEIFSQLTDGRYPFVELKEDMTMMVHSKDHVAAVEQLSRGTICQLYFALRMAANEVLCQEEDLPVILDDAFVMYDEARLERTLEWLSKQRKQILILSCQKRERDMLYRMGISYHEVRLER